MAEDEIKKYLPQIKIDWQVLPARIGYAEGVAGGDNPSATSGQVKKLHKEFKFKDFKEAMDFVNKVAKIAEEENHHPNILINYSKVYIDIWTHSIDGLHENDFILAAKIDTI